MVVATLGATAPELTYPISTERIATGVERLDTMLGGGYFRGSTVQITGGPGTGKTTLAGAFMLAACRRGETALMVSFDEVSEEIQRNLTSVNMNLAPCLAQGALTIEAIRTESRSAEEHLLYLKSLIETRHPHCMVIDPVTALVKAGGLTVALTVVQRLVRLTKAQGITLLCTSLTESSDPLTEAGAIADFHHSRHLDSPVLLHSGRGAQPRTHHHQIPRHQALGSGARIDPERRGRVVDGCLQRARGGADGHAPRGTRCRSSV